MSRIIVIFFAALVLVPAAFAAPRAIGQYKDWTVYTETIGPETLCFATTEASDKAPRSASHGDVHFYVTSWKSGKARNQPSLKVGFDLRPDLPGKASIGRASWTLLSSGQEGFVEDKDDADLVRALKRGNELRIETTSERNLRVTYHFSLAGSSSAIDRALAACG